MAEELLEVCADDARLSFYGLAHHLGEVGDLLEKADRASISKAPRAEDEELVRHKAQLVEAQARLRRTMGSRLEQPSLTKRELPFAEEFLKEQVAKLEKHKGSDARAARAVERLREISDGVRGAAPVPESRAVRTVEASIKQLEVEWRELSPVHEKWEAGRHSFKSNADLQAFRRRYDECVKSRAQAKDKLHRALCQARGPEDAEKKEKDGSQGGWAAAVRKQAPVAKSGVAGRAAAPRPPPAPRRNAWGTAMVSFAQRIRADISASVREEAQAKEADVGEVREEVEAEEAHADEEPVPPPPPPPPRRAATKPQHETNVFADRPPPPVVKPKAPPPGVPSAGGAVPSAVDPESGPDEDDEPSCGPTSTMPQVSSAPGYAASAKKKGKAAKRKKTGKEDEVEDVPTKQDPTPRKPPGKSAWVTAAYHSISGSVLQELLGQQGWSLPDDDVALEQRLDNLSARLPWSSPLGLQLPLDWSEFAGLELDGGPRRTSKRGTSPWILRLQMNVPRLLAHYVTIVFWVMLLHSLSHFGTLLWLAVAQAVLILAPAHVKEFRAQARVLALQVAHLLLWIFFVRSIWQMHVFVKVFTMVAIGAHSYVVAEEVLVTE